VQLADRDVGGAPGSSVPTQRLTPRTARRLKPDEVAALLAAYRTGRTMKELATEFGVSRQTVAAHLRRAKAPGPPSGPQP